MTTHHGATPTPVTPTTLPLETVLLAPVVPHAVPMRVLVHMRYLADTALNDAQWATRP